MEKKGVGICKAATQTCAADGQSWGPCTGEVPPQPAEDCTTPVDDNCDGQVNEASAGCCMPPSTATCYGGPMGTDGVGNCKVGMKACSATTHAYGPCTGEVVPAKEDCYTTGDEDCDGNACSDPVWDLAFNDANGEQVTDVVVDSKGDVYLAGYFNGSLGVDGQSFPSVGQGQYYLIKLDHQAPHHVLWHKLLGDGNNNGATIYVAVDKDDSVIIAGEVYSSIDFGGGSKMAPAGQDAAFVAKYDSQGQYKWDHLFGNANGAQATSVAVDSQGNIILAGAWYGGTLDFTTTQLASGGPGFAAGFTPDGANVWSTGLSTGSVTRIAAAPSAPTAVFLAGYFMNTLTLGANKFVSSGGRDVFVAKLDGGGSIVTSAAYGSIAEDFAASISVSAAGTVAIAGNYGATIDFGTGTLTPTDGDGFVAVFDSSLVPAWSKGFGAYGNSHVTLDPNGNTFLAGNTNSDVNFGAGVLKAVGTASTYLVKFDPTGGVLWNKLFGTQQVIAQMIARDPSTGSVVIGGTFTGSLSFGLPPLAGKGNAYVAEFQY